MRCIHQKFTLSALPSHFFKCDPTVLPHSQHSPSFSCLSAIFSIFEISPRLFTKGISLPEKIKEEGQASEELSPPPFPTLPLEIPKAPSSFTASLSQGESLCAPLSSLLSSLTTHFVCEYYWSSLRGLLPLRYKFLYHCSDADMRKLDCGWPVVAFIDFITRNGSQSFESKSKRDEFLQSLKEGGSHGEHSERAFRFKNFNDLFEFSFILSNPLFITSVMEGLSAVLHDPHFTPLVAMDDWRLWSIIATSGLAAPYMALSSYLLEKMSSPSTALSTPSLLFPFSFTEFHSYKPPSYSDSPLVDPSHSVKRKRLSMQPVEIATEAVLPPFSTSQTQVSSQHVKRIQLKSFELSSDPSASHSFVEASPLLLSESQPSSTLRKGRNSDP
ncbi:hypothetical protein IE077_001989, partial [Cardiosporidium cionae]